MNAFTVIVFALALLAAGLVGMKIENWRKRKSHEIGHVVPVTAINVKNKAMTAPIRKTAENRPESAK